MLLLPVIVLGVGLIGLVCASTLAGLWLGRRVVRHRTPESEHLSTIQGALLGLLGLVLSFSFASAMSRFFDRQDAIAAEANAIETAYQRAELLPSPHAQAARAALSAYAGARLRFAEHADETAFDGPARRDARVTLEQELDRHQAAARAAVLAGVRETPQYAALVVPALDAVGDALVRRNALMRRALPTELAVILIVCSCATMATVGYGVGLAEKRSIAATMTLAGLVGVVLFMTFDFNRPDNGWVRVNITPLADLPARLGQ